MISDGSVGTFCSKITLPASSTTHTDVSFTDTSRPTKCAISSLLPRCSRSPDLDPFIATEGDARSASKAEPQPPRYTIFRGQKPNPGKWQMAFIANSVDFHLLLPVSAVSFLVESP